MALSGPTVLPGTRYDCSLEKGTNMHFRDATATDFPAASLLSSFRQVLPLSPDFSH